MRQTWGLLIVGLATACGASVGDEATAGGGAELVATTPGQSSTSSGGTATGGTTTGGATSGSETGGASGTSTGSLLPCCHPTGGFGSTTGDGAGACTCEGERCQQSCNTPLCLSFDGAPTRFVQAPGRFAVAEGIAADTDWIAAKTPWLALDRDGDGRIDDGRELFGSMTRLPDGHTAQNGFEALKALDTNHDGRITPADAMWSRLRLWSDANQDRLSQAMELKPLSSRGIEAIELAYTNVPRCDDRGNCEVERGLFWYRSHGRLLKGRIVDVHLALRGGPAVALAQPSTPIWWAFGPPGAF